MIRDFGEDWQSSPRGLAEFSERIGGVLREV
jgi:hypothetical protein